MKRIQNKKHKLDYYWWLLLMVIIDNYWLLLMIIIDDYMKNCNELTFVVL